MIGSVEIMNIEQIHEYCLSKEEVTESFPFDDSTLVFKVFNRMFALMNLEGDLSVNLKCDPERALELKEKYPAVRLGYHMNKKYWNTVIVDESVSDTILKTWIDHSYDEVVKKLPKTKQQQLKKH